VVKAHGADNVVMTVKILACVLVCCEGRVDQAGFYDESWTSLARGATWALPMRGTCGGYM
jgi:hypothetical protein